MPKMYLPARVPNLGAHKLAWFLGTRSDPLAAIVEAEKRLGVGMVDRILCGEVVPASGLANDAAAITGLAINPRDWRRPSPASWGDRPMGFAHPGTPFVAPTGYARQAGIEGGARLTTAVQIKRPERRAA